MCTKGWEWKKHAGQKMINKVASSFQVDFCLECMIKCTLSPICDSYNYRPSDKTCELNTHDTQHTLDSCVHADSGLVLLTRRASSTHTTLHSLPTQPTSSLTMTGPGGEQSSATSSKWQRVPAATFLSTALQNGSIYSSLAILIIFILIKLHWNAQPIAIYSAYSLYLYEMNIMPHLTLKLENMHSWHRVNTK